MPTIGVPTAAAMCAGPVSPETYSDAPRASATTSAIVVFGESAAAPDEPSTASCAIASSPGPHVITDIRPWRARISAASAPKRAGIQRLLGHAAPGLRIA